MLDLNDDGPTASLMALLDKAEANAETDFEIGFCESLREKLRTYGGRVTLSAAQQHKLQLYCTRISGHKVGVKRPA